MRMLLKFLAKFIFIFVFLSIFLSISGCLNTKIKIGFIGSLTGKYSSMGISARNAAVLAINNYNENKQFFQKEIILVSKDYSENSISAEEIAAEFKKEGISIVITQLTSSPGLEFIKASASIKESAKASSTNKLLILSSTISSSKLTGIDDYIIRTTGDADQLGLETAGYMIDDGVQNIAAIYDTANRDYSIPLYNSLKSSVESAGKSIVYTNDFQDKTNDGYRQISDSLRDKRPDAVVFIASGIDSGKLIQILKRDIADVVYYGTSWTKTSNFLEHSGRFGEGTRIIGFYEPEKYSDTPYGRYYRQYREVYDVETSFMSDYTYELTELIINSILKAGTTDPDRLKKYIIQKKFFTGIVDNFEIDEYGDCKRNLEKTIVKDGKYEKLK